MGNIRIKYTSDQNLASFPGPAQLFIAISTEKHFRTNSDGKLGGAWVRG